jgi:hypothetical protein
VNRRRFLFAGAAGLSAVATGGLSAIAKSAASNPMAPASITAAVGVSPYGAGVRAKILEVIVRQALAGAPWREICAGPMQVNQIAEAEVELEVARRRKLLDEHPYHFTHTPSCPACCSKREALTKEELEQRMNSEHPSHTGFLSDCPMCHTNWRAGRALRLRDGAYEWVD